MEYGAPRSYPYFLYAKYQLFSTYPVSGKIVPPALLRNVKSGDSLLIIAIGSPSPSRTAPSSKNGLLGEYFLSNVLIVLPTVGGSGIFDLMN